MCAMLLFRRFLVLVLGIVALGGAIACESSGHGVVYVSQTGEGSEIYVVDPDSGDAAAIAGGPTSHLLYKDGSGPKWSPDGQKIAFVSEDLGNLNIYVADRANFDERDVAAIEAITSSDGNEDSPTWSPDGDSVAYTTDVDGHSDVYVSAPVASTNGPGGSPVRITTAETEEFLGDWSPDGQWLVFSRRGDEATQGLWLRNPAGVNLFQLTSDNDLSPVWSPDGDAIAFVRNIEGNRDIYLLHPQDGDDWRGPVRAERIAASPEADHSPDWAPDGDTLVYVSERDGNAEIYLLETDKDGPPLRLTTNEAQDTQPVWSPDGNRIAFVSDVHGEGEVFIMDADGSNQKRLTHNDVRDHSPDW